MPPRRSTQTRVLAAFGSAGLLAVLASPLVVVAQRSPAVATTPTFATEIRPVVARFCAPCHAGKSAAGGLDLDRFRTEQSVVQNPAVWIKVVANVRGGHMPPKGSPRPTKAQADRLVAWVESTLASAGCDLREPGRVTIRRLNRTEYDHTIRDLLALDVKASKDFPSDDIGYGFDNNGDVLSLSPLLIEKYLVAAEDIAARAIVVPGPRARRYGPEDMGTAGGVAAASDGVRTLASNGAVTVEHAFAEPGEYRIRVRAYASRAGDEPAKMAIALDRGQPATFDVTADRRQPAWYETPVRTSAGKARLSAAFTNDFYDPTNPNPQLRDRNLYIEAIEVVGPLGEVARPESHRRVIPEDPPAGQEAAFGKAQLTRFAERAYRRPVTPAEAERLGRLFERAFADTRTYEGAMRLGLTAVLASPSFLFRAETDPDPTRGRELGAWELASRLSYFLWASMPDERLFSLARTGELLKPAVLRQEAVRMLKDPKAWSLSEDFAGQWLQLPRLGEASPDPQLFRMFDDSLRQAMREETLRFFDAVVREDRSVTDVLQGPYTFVNETLARHYGIENVRGPGFVRVALKDGRRAGILTQASILTLTSNPNRTSPVKRGKWVLEQILGTPPPPPPPGVGDLANEGKKVEGKTLRERLEEHRKNPTCASCHSRMDPIGFGLENFDAVGQWRDREGDLAINARGDLPDGSSFDGPAGLRRVLLAKKGLFVRNVGAKLLTYALGRGLRPEDDCYVDDVARAAEKAGNSFSAFVEAIVVSEPFRMRGPLPTATARQAAASKGKAPGQKP